MNSRKEAMLWFTLLTVAMVTNCAEEDKNRNTMIHKPRSFCFVSEDCPDMQYCRKHQCKFPATIAEFRTVAKIFNGRQRQIKSEDEPCITHFDCKANGYLCDRQQGRCRKAHDVFVKITNKCKDLKKSCLVDSDCSCPGYRMKCEAEASGDDRECVIASQSLSQPSAMSTKTKRRVSRKSRLIPNETEQP